MIITIGNIFDSKADVLVNTVNCVGVMGKGIALDFKKRFPAMFSDYSERCAAHELKPGKPYYYHDLAGASVINFPTKDHWRSPSKLSYIIDGLDWFVENYESYGIKSVAFPPLGCGNGGLTWDIIGPIMYQKLIKLPIYIEIYAPFGTSPDKLKPEFLCKGTNGTADIIGERSARLNPKWYLLLYIVKELSNNRYALSVGRTIFQKICYVLTRTGVNTGFAFTKGSYGPYSTQVKEAITILSNSNLMTESSAGKMMKMTVSDRFVFDQSAFTVNEMSAARQTIDLFSRIKNTEQAEIIATVMYSYDELKKSGSVQDIDVYNYVMDWKPHWKDDKKEIVCDTIANLTILDWMKVIHSEQIQYSDDI